MILRYRHVWSNTSQDWETVDSDIGSITPGFADCDTLRSLWDNRELSNIEKILKDNMVRKWAFYPHGRPYLDTISVSYYKGIEYESTK